MTHHSIQPTTDLPWEEYDKPDLVTRHIELMRKLVIARTALEEIAWMDEFLNADVAREMMNTARSTLKDITK